MGGKKIRNRFQGYVFSIGIPERCSLYFLQHLEKRKHNNEE